MERSFLHNSHPTLALNLSSSSRMVDTSTQTDQTVSTFTQDPPSVENKIKMLEVSLALALQVSEERITKRLGERLDRLEVSVREIHKEMAKGFSDLTQLLKAPAGTEPMDLTKSAQATSNIPTPHALAQAEAMASNPVEASSSTRPNSPGLNPKSRGKCLIVNEMMLIGGRADMKVPVSHYNAIMRKARNYSRDSDKYMALKLLKDPAVFSPEELAQCNATGFTRAHNKKSPYPMLDRGRMDALCRQVLIEYPTSHISCGDGSCSIMQAMNSFCRKRKLQWDRYCQEEDFT